MVLAKKAADLVQDVKENAETLDEHNQRKWYDIMSDIEDDFLREYSHLKIVDSDNKRYRICGNCLHKYDLK